MREPINPPLSQVPSVSLPTPTPSQTRTFLPDRPPSSLSATPSPTQPRTEPTGPVSGARPRTNEDTCHTPLLPRSTSPRADRACSHWYLFWRNHQHRCAPELVRPGYGSIPDPHGGPRKDARGVSTSVGLGAVMFFGVVWVVAVLFWAWKISESPSRLLPSLIEWPSNKTISTKGISKIWANSHNDENQNRDALTLALSLGYGFIEVDIHLASVSDSTDDLTLLVGHDASDLDSRLTVQSMYLDPLMRILDKHNQNRSAKGDWVGIYEGSPSEDVVVFFDMKSDGSQTWPYLQTALDPFLRKGYLTTYDPVSRTLSPGPLTIVGTGNTPIANVYHSPLRSVFYDAPLLDLYRPYDLPASPAGPAVTFNWTSSISPVASSKFPIPSYLSLLPSFVIPNPHRCNLSLISAIAAERGILSRWWGVLHQPWWMRRYLWEVLWQSGVGVLNADELAEMKRWLDRKHGKAGGKGC